MTHNFRLYALIVYFLLLASLLIFWLAVQPYSARASNVTYTTSGGMLTNTSSVTATAGNNAPIVGLTKVLYDGALGGTPDTQGFGYFAFPGASNTASGGVTTLDTNSNNNIQTGYGITSTILNRATGYTLRFTAQVLTETHPLALSDKNGDGVGDRAGFSVIAISNDGQRGIELGFWTNQIWAQNDGTAEPPPNTNTLFTHGESANFNTTTDLIPYELRVLNDAYSLVVTNTEILSGNLRDYTAFVPTTPPFIDPYEVENFIFFGDDTSSARAIIKISHISVITDAPLPGRTIGSNTPLVIDKIGLMDIDEGGQSALVTFTVNSGVLDLTTTAPGGLTTGQVSGNGSKTVVTTAPLGQINASLLFTPALIYQSQPGFSGLDTLTVKVNDQGHTGGGALVGQKSAAIIVTSTNAPTQFAYLPAIIKSN